MHTKKCFFIILFIFFSLTPGIDVSAHGNERSFEKNIGSYFVDIGYSEKAVTNSPLQFDFEIYESKNSSSTNNKVLFSDIWVRIEKDGGTILATGIYRPKFGKAGLLYVPQNAGIYTVHFRFENQELSLAESSFDIEVVNDDFTIPLLKKFLFLAVILVLILTLIVLLKKKIFK